MKAPLFVFVAGLLTATCAAPGEPRNSGARPAQPRRPNIVVVLVDDMRWDDMRVAGHPFIDTPHMDRLAREGARFTNAFATTPLCSPSRASFLTGQYAHTNGIIDNTARPSHDLPVFPLELQRAGYRTGFFGKWHMGNDDSPRPGFDHWVAMPGQGEAIDPSLNVDGERVHSQGLHDRSADRLRRAIHRPSFRSAVPRLPGSQGHPSQRDSARRREPGADSRTARRVRGRRAPPRPLCRPRDAAARERVQAAARKAGAASPDRRSAAARPEDRDDGRGDPRAASRCCWVSTTAWDASSATLERKGVLDDTVVVFTSDHGYFYGEHGLNEERRLAYEETIRIPLHHSVSAAGVGGLDAESDGAEHRPRADAARPGRTPGRAPISRAARSCRCSSRRRRSGARRSSSSTSATPSSRAFGTWATWPSRTDRHKYIQYRELQGMDELYDLDADPYEETNIIDRPDARDDAAADAVRAAASARPDAVRRAPGWRRLRAPPEFLRQRRQMLEWWVRWLD